MTPTHRTTRILTGEFLPILYLSFCLGLSLSNISNTSTNSTESDREDCTPFRRPDIIGHDPLAVKQQSIGKSGLDQPNGFLSQTALEKGRQLAWKHVP